MSERRLTKIRVKDGKVEIRFQRRADPERPWDDYSMICADLPRPELESALQDLAVDVIEICCLPDDYREGVTISGASYSYGGEDEVMGATVTALKTLLTASSPLVINTPHLPSEPYSDGDTETPLMSRKMCNRLLALEGEAFRYVDGERAQGDLFSSEAAADLAGAARELVPKKGSGIESVTVEAGGRSVTLEAQ